MLPFSNFQPITCKIDIMWPQYQVWKFLHHLVSSTHLIVRVSGCWCVGGCDTWHRWRCVTRCHGSSLSGNLRLILWLIFIVRAFFPARHLAPPRWSSPGYIKGVKENSRNTMNVCWVDVHHRWALLRICVNKTTNRWSFVEKCPIFRWGNCQNVCLKLCLRV